MSVRTGGYWEPLVELARRERRSLNNMILVLLEQSLEKKKCPPRISPRRATVRFSVSGRYAELEAMLF